MNTNLCSTVNRCRYVPLFWKHCSVAKSYPALCDPMDCSTPGFPVLHPLPELAQTHIHWVGDAIQSLILCGPFSCLQSFPASGSFPMSRLFTSSSQSIRASASVLPMNIQSWFPLGLTGLISLNICMVVKYMYTCACLRSDIKQRRRNLLSLCSSLFRSCFEFLKYCVHTMIYLYIYIYYIIFPIIKIILLSVKDLKNTIT